MLEKGLDIKNILWRVEDIQRYSFVGFDLVKYLLSAEIEFKLSNYII